MSMITGGVSKTTFKNTTISFTILGTTTSSPLNNGPCLNVKSTDLIADKNDISSYYLCNGKSPVPIAHYTCSHDLIFDEIDKMSM